MIEYPILLHNDNSVDISLTMHNAIHGQSFDKLQEYLTSGKRRNSFPRKDHGLPVIETFRSNNRVTPLGENLK